MKKLYAGILVMLIAFLSMGTLQADELDENLTLKEALEGLQFAARVVRKAAMEEGYSWEESRMVAVEAAEAIKEGLSDAKLMKQVRERSRLKIKENKEEMLKTRSRTQSRTRTEDGNMPDDAKRQINRAEKDFRSEDGIGRNK